MDGKIYAANAYDNKKIGLQGIVSLQLYWTYYWLRLKS